MALDRHRQRGIARIKHHGVVDLDAVVREPFGQPGVDLVCAKRPAKLYFEGRGRQHDRAALHQELVDGEALLVIERLRCEHQQKIGVLRDVSVFQVGVLDANVLRKYPVQPVEAQSARTVRRRFEHRHGLEESRGQALERGIDRALHGVFVERRRQRHLRGFTAAIEHHIEPERLGIEQAGDLRTEAVTGLQFLRQPAAVGVRVAIHHLELAVRLLDQIAQQRFDVAAQAA